MGADRVLAALQRTADSRTPRWVSDILLLACGLAAGSARRPGRPLASSALFATSTAGALPGWGFVGPPPPFRNSIIYALTSLLSLPTSSAVTTPLTLTGEILRIVLRVTGPVLLGLALLSIRNRVKG